MLWKKNTECSVDHKTELNKFNLLIYTFFFTILTHFMHMFVELKLT